MDKIKKIKIMTMLAMASTIPITMLPVYAYSAGDTYVNSRAMHYFTKIILTYDKSLFVLFLLCLLICLVLSCRNEKQFQFFLNSLKVFMVTTIILNLFVLLWKTVNWIVSMFDGRAV